MTSTKFRVISFCGLLAITVFALVGCNSEQQYALRATGTSNALEGEVSVSEDNLGNTTLDIEVRDLADQRSADVPKYYVAWAKNTSDPERLGLLNIDGRNGDLIATTDLNKFTVMITAEKSTDVSQPSGTTVLRSKTINVE